MALTLDDVQEVLGADILPDRSEVTDVSNTNKVCISCELKYTSIIKLITCKKY